MENTNPTVEVNVQVHDRSTPRELWHRCSRCTKQITPGREEVIDGLYFGKDCAEKVGIEIARHHAQMDR